MHQFCHLGAVVQGASNPIPPCWAFLLPDLKLANRTNSEKSAVLGGPNTSCQNSTGSPMVRASQTATPPIKLLSSFGMLKSANDECFAPCCHFNNQNWNVVTMGAHRVLFLEILTLHWNCGPESHCPAVKFFSTREFKCSQRNFNHVKFGLTKMIQKCVEMKRFWVFLFPFPHT